MMTTRTTFHLALSRPALALARVRSWLAQRDPIAVVTVLIVAVLAVAALTTPLWRPSAPIAIAAAVPTPALSYILIATVPAQPTADRASAALLGGHVLARAVVAYDSPSGRVIGAIDSGHSYTVVARSGADWLQADVQGSGVVWLKTSDVFDLPQGLADLAPTATPQTVYVSAPAAPAPAPTYQVDNAPAADVLGPPPTQSADDRAADQAYRQQIGLSDADMDQALREHQAQQAASCAAGRITNAAYCQAVQQWMEEHR
jgi:hypothetical protein